MNHYRVEILKSDGSDEVLKTIQDLTKEEAEYKSEGAYDLGYPSRVIDNLTGEVVSEFEV